MSTPCLTTLGPEGQPPLLIIPGNNLTGAFYRPAGELLAKRGYRVHLATLDAPQPSGSWEAHTANVAQLAQGCLGGRGILMGHSLGALPALLAAAHDSHLARGLILMEPAIVTGARWAGRSMRSYQKREHEIELRGRDYFDNWTGTILRVAEPESFPDAALEIYLKTRHQGGIGAGALIANLPSLYPLPFKRLAMPTLILRGAHSGWRQRMNLASLCRAIPGAETVVVKGAGHWMANEQDSALAAAIEDFARSAGVVPSSL